jgi:hypothetical protein
MIIREVLEEDTKQYLQILKKLDDRFIDEYYMGKVY